MSIGVRISSNYYGGLPFKVILDRLSSKRIKTLSDIMNGVYLPMILLLRSGDIETNPGPITSSAVSEKELSELSELISPSYYDKLGINLEILYAQLQAIKERSHSTSEAFLRVFMKWRDKQSKQTNIRAVLAEKLEESGLAELSGDLLDGSLIPGMTPQPSLTAELQTHQPLSPEQIQRCAEDFKDTYRTSLCQIRTDPLNPDSLVQFEDMYTHLVMEEERGEDKCPLKYSDLLKLRYNGKFPRRLMVQGEAGAGKTTFCAKIAWDWIIGKYFQEFEWVIIIPLREHEQRTLGEIAKSYLPEKNPATASQLTEYMRSNADKVFIVFDGLDEFKGKVTKPKEDGSKSTDLQSQSTSSIDSSKYQSKQGSSDGSNMEERRSSGNKDIEIVEILRSEKLKHCPVMVTTRPWKAREIRWNDQLRKMYRFLYIEGFSRENLDVYIRKYFAGNETKANDLIQFIGDNDIISENMAPYPIYVAMLCLMWKEFDEKRQEVMKSLQTFSQVFQEMIIFLKEHYAQKLVTQSCSLDNSLNDHLEQIDNLLKPIASLALKGLLNNTLVFTEDEFEHCKQSMETACRVGVLSQENSILSRDRRRYRRSRRLLSTAFFPHKLFQEFMAGIHLASLYETDNGEYNRLMTEVVVPRKEEFRYLLYFTSSESQAVGSDVISHLLKHVPNQNKQTLQIKDFLVDVAFECHNSKVSDMVKDNILPDNATFMIHRNMTAHTAAGYAFIGIAAYMVQLVVYRHCGPTLSHDVAEMICSSPSLREVELNETLHGNFCHKLAARGQFSMAQSLTMTDVKVSASASADLAAGVCKLPHLTNLTMNLMPLHDEFSSTLRAMANSMKVQSLSMSSVEVSASASADLAAGVCKLPHLTELIMNGMPLPDEFCSTLRAMANSMKVQSLTMKDVKVSASASADLAAGVCTLPYLTELTMYWMPLHDEFCSTLRAMANSIKVQSLNLEGIQVSASASADLAAGVCKLPHLTELTMKRVPLHDEFCSTLRAMANSMKVQSLTMSYVQVSASASADLAAGVCTLPHLTELTLCNMPLHDEFCLTVKAMANSMKAQSLTMTDVGVSASASADLAAGVCTLPHLTELTMKHMPLHDEFCSTLRAMAPSMKAQSLTISDVKVSASASADLAAGVCKLPHLTELTMKRMPLHDEFCLTVKAMAPSLKVQSLTMSYVQVSASASADLAAGVCTLPHLTELTLCNMPLHDEFCLTVKAMAPSMKIQSVTLRFVCQLSVLGSVDLATGLCSLSHLTKLSVKTMSLYDEFCAVIKAKASTIKVQSLTIEACKLKPQASTDLAAAFCAMTHLTELTMNLKPLHAEFCSTLEAKTLSMKCGFPPMSQGKFTFNGISHRSLESLRSHAASRQSVNNPTL